MYIAKKRDFENIELRLLEDSDKDLKMIVDWLLQEKIYSTFFDKRLNSSEIVNHYKHYFEFTIYDRAYIIEYDRTPIGVVEHYYLKPMITKKAANNYSAFGVKIFIGNTDYWDYGIGSATLDIITNKIFTKYGIDYVFANILKSNTTAINCFKRAGFRKKDSYKENDREYLFMVKSNMGIFNLTL